MVKKIGLILIFVGLLVGGYYVFGTKGVETSVEDQIAAALAQKNNWDASKVEINITTINGDYAKGDVRLMDEAGGGLWFAAKVNDTWKIVYDGNGIITCDLLSNYQDFPKDLIPQCFDTQTDNLVTR